MATVRDMAKKKPDSESPDPASTPAKGREKVMIYRGVPDETASVPETTGRDQTTVRVYKHTAFKLGLLCRHKNMGVADLIEAMFGDLIDHELIAVTEASLAAMKKPG